MYNLKSSGDLENDYWSTQFLAVSCNWVLGKAMQVHYIDITIHQVPNEVLS